MIGPIASAITNNLILLFRWRDTANVMLGALKNEERHERYQCRRILWAAGAARRFALEIY